MDYIEYNIRLIPYDETTAEILVAELGDEGFDSFTETENGINAYIPVGVGDEAQIRNLLQNNSYPCTIEYSTQLIKAQNWNALWESNFDPVVIGNRCTIRAAFHTNLPATELDILIAPKMAFGTGHHATTYLMTEALLDRDVKGLRVLDMGCGTGILAIVAALRGAATPVDAIDNDEWATENTHENAGLNQVSDKLNIILGDASSLPSTETYQLILANINRNILLADMPAYVKALHTGGNLLVSGIYTHDIPVIEEKAASLGLVKQFERERNNWAMVAFQKQ